MNSGFWQTLTLTLSHNSTEITLLLVYLGFDKYNYISHEGGSYPPDRKGMLVGTKMLFCGRALNFFSPLRGPNFITTHFVFSAPVHRKAKLSLVRGKVLILLKYYLQLKFCSVNRWTIIHSFSAANEGTTIFTSLVCLINGGTIFYSFNSVNRGTIFYSLWECAS